MAKSESQPTVSLIAAATFGAGDLYKFVSVNSSGHAVIGPTTGAGQSVIGVLLSRTSTSGAGSEPVTVGLLSGKGPVRMAGSTAHAGNTFAASSNGYGIAPTTNKALLGTVVEGSSGSTGRVVTAVFHYASDPISS